MSVICLSVKNFDLILADPFTCNKNLVKTVL